MENALSTQGETQSLHLFCLKSWQALHELSQPVLPADNHLSKHSDILGLFKF
jgi:hypothetical protein